MPFRCHLVFNEAKTDVLVLKLDSLDSLVALHLESEIIIWKATKVSFMVVFENSQKLNINVHFP